MKNIATYNLWLIVWLPFSDCESYAQEPPKPLDREAVIRALEDANEQTLVPNSPAVRKLTNNIDQLHLAASEITQELIAIAQDKRQTDDTRRESILTLGQLKDKQATQFLIGHVDLYIPKRITATDEDQLLETPCLYALYKGDWWVARQIIESLHGQISELNLARLGNALKRILGRTTAVAMVDTYSTDHRVSRRQESNLVTMKRFMLQ